MKFQALVVTDWNVGSVHVECWTLTDLARLVAVVQVGARVDLFVGPDFVGGFDVTRTVRANAVQMAKAATKVWRERMAA